MVSVRFVVCCNAPLVQVTTNEYGVLTGLELLVVQPPMPSTTPMSSVAKLAIASVGAAK